MRTWLSMLVLLAFAVPQGLAFACAPDAHPEHPGAAHEHHAHHDHDATPAHDPGQHDGAPVPDRHHGEGIGCTMAMPCGIAAIAQAAASPGAQYAEERTATLTPVTLLRSSDPTRDPPPPRRPAWN